MMNDRYREGLLSGAIQVETPPDRIKVEVDWLEDQVGRGDLLGRVVAIGLIEPAVYRVYSASGPFGGGNAHYWLKLVAGAPS